MRNAFRAGAPLLALALCACATATPGIQDGPLNVVVNDTKNVRSGDYVSTAWISDDFDGQHSRILTGNRLEFQVINAADQGGWDGSVRRPNDAYSLLPVGDVGAGAVICSAYAVDMDRPDGSNAAWWAGPKISVNWQAQQDPARPGDWYENYVVEIGSKSPAQWERDMRSWIELDLFAQTEIAGSLYKHYKVRYQQWWQFWSVRQEPRAAGAVPIKDILDAWRINDLPAAYRVDSVKANVEVHGPADLRGKIAASFNAGDLRAATGSCIVPEL